MRYISVRDSQSTSGRQRSRVSQRGHPGHRVGTDSKRLVFAGTYRHRAGSGSGIIHAPCVCSLLEADGLDRSLVLRLGGYRWRCFQRSELRHLRSRVQFPLHGDRLLTHGDFQLHRTLRPTRAAGSHRIAPIREISLELYRREIYLYRTGEAYCTQQVSDRGRRIFDRGRWAPDFSDDRNSLCSEGPMPCQVGADLTSRVQHERTKLGLAKYKAGFDGASKVRSSGTVGESTR